MPKDCASLTYDAFCSLPEKKCCHCQFRKKKVGVIYGRLTCTNTRFFCFSSAHTPFGLPYTRATLLRRVTRCVILHLSWSSHFYSSSIVVLFCLLIIELTRFSSSVNNNNNNTAQHSVFFIPSDLFLFFTEACVCVYALVIVPFFCLVFLLCFSNVPCLTTTTTIKCSTCVRFGFSLISSSNSAVILSNSHPI